MAGAEGITDGEFLQTGILSVLERGPFSLDGICKARGWEDRREDVAVQISYLVEQEVVCQRGEIYSI